VFLDVTASAGGRATMLDVVRRTAVSVFIPLTVGGGVRSVSDVDALLRAGADKVGVNTAAIARPALIAEIAERFGRQVLTLSLDVRRATGLPSGFEVTTHGGREGTGRTRSSGPGRVPGSVPARSSSTRWTTTAPGTASIWT
jgi:cyclase